MLTDLEHYKYRKRQKFSLNKRFVNVKMHQVTVCSVFSSLKKVHDKIESILAIYNNFLTELWRLRLTAARETVDIINSAESTISGDIGQTPIKLAAEVCGLGPVFQLFLIIENMSSRKIAADLCVLLHCDHRHFLLDKPYKKVIQFMHKFVIKILQIDSVFVFSSL